MTLDWLARRTTSAISEEELMAGYAGRVVARKRCACGGWIVAHGADDVSVTVAVQDHQATIRHLAWRSQR